MNPNKKHSDRVSICQSNWTVDVPENKLIVAVVMIKDCDERHSQPQGLCVSTAIATKFENWISHG